MKRLLNFIIILSISLFVFGCAGPTIDVDSDEIDHIKEISKGIVGYMGEPFSGILTKSFENGQLKFKKPYKDGKEDGVREVYYEDGQLKIKATYKDGKEDGIWKEYFENGQLKIKGTFKDGKEDGIWKEYYEDGQLKFKTPYKDGKEDGVLEVYFENGQLKLKNTFKDGKEDGVREEYFENGQFKSKVSYKDGEQDVAAEEESTTSTIKIGNLEVMTFDLGEMTLVEANINCDKGYGWRLPTKDELNILYENKDKIGGFNDGNYWSSTRYGYDYAWAKQFDNGRQNYSYPLNYNSVRAVRFSNQSDVAAEGESTTSTIKIGNLEVMTENLGDMSWDEANIACAKVGYGWRLPTKDELNILYENKDKIGGFASSYYYWSSNEGGEDYAWAQYFNYGRQNFSDKFNSNSVRPVRALESATSNHVRALESATLNQSDVAAEGESTTSTIKIGNLEVMTENLGDMSWDEANIACAKVGYGWRLPTSYELNMLYEYKVKVGGFASSYHYWSSTEGSEDEAFAVDFECSRQTRTGKFNYNSVRAVRALESATSTIKIGNLEVNAFHLGSMRWDEAKIACAKLGDGWRLPTKDELNILYENRRKLGYFTDSDYWSSTESMDNATWAEDFTNGKQFKQFKSTTGSIKGVLAVRAF